MLFSCLWHWWRKLWKMPNKEKKEKKDRRDRRHRRSIMRILKNLRKSHHRRCKKLRKRINIIKTLRRTETGSILKSKTKGSITPSWESAMSFKLKNKMMKNRRNLSIQSITLLRNTTRRPLKTYFLKTTNLKSMSQSSRIRPISIRIMKKISMIRTILSKSFRSIRVRSILRMSQRRNLQKNQRRMSHKRFVNLLVIRKFPRTIQRLLQIKKND